MMPMNLLLFPPSSVTATVEWPVFFITARSSCKVVSGFTLESLRTNPALWDFTLAIMAACDSTDWEQKMKARPPWRARAMPMSGPETACMLAVTRGMFRWSRLLSPALKRATGHSRETFLETCSLLVRRGIKRYSEKVREISSNIRAMSEFIKSPGLCHGGPDRRKPAVTEVKPPDFRRKAAYPAADTIPARSWCTCFQPSSGITAPITSTTSLPTLQPRLADRSKSRPWVSPKRNPEAHRSPA